MRCCAPAISPASIFTWISTTASKGRSGACASVATQRLSRSNASECFVVRFSLLIACPCPTATAPLVPVAALVMLVLPTSLLIMPRGEHIRCYPVLRLELAEQLVHRQLGHVQPRLESG